MQGELQFWANLRQSKDGHISQVYYGELASTTVASTNRQLISFGNHYIHEHKNIFCTADFVARGIRIASKQLVTAKTTHYLHHFGRARGLFIWIQKQNMQLLLEDNKLHWPGLVVSTDSSQCFLQELALLRLFSIGLSPKWLIPKWHASSAAPSCGSLQNHLESQNWTRQTVESIHQVNRSRPSNLWLIYSPGFSTFLKALCIQNNKNRKTGHSSWMHLSTKRTGHF